MDRSKHKAGFTLVELMIVVSILAILAGIVFPIYQSNDLAAKTAVTASNKRMMEIKVQEYYTANNAYPWIIDRDWFTERQIPENAFMPYQDWPKDTYLGYGSHPDRTIADYKIINPSFAKAQPIYYNRTYGTFTFRIPDQGNDADNIELFNASNNAGITVMNQKHPF